MKSHNYNIMFSLSQAPKGQQMKNNNDKTNATYETDNTRTNITKTRLLKYIENLTTKKWKLSDEILWQFSYYCSKQKIVGTR